MKTFSHGKIEVSRQDRNVLIKINELQLKIED